MNRHEVADLQPLGPINPQTETNFSVLCHEFHPIGATEEFLVGELAHRAEQLAALRQNVSALQDAGSRALKRVTRPNGEEKGSEAAVHVLATSGGRVDELQRQSLGHAGAFYRALATLRQLQADRRGAKLHRIDAIDPRFRSDADCRAWLEGGFRRGERACPHCGEAGRGCYLAARRAWECGQCRRQSGIQSGTLIKNSTIPLSKWFAAIRLVLLTPSIGTLDLAQAIQIRRNKTVASMREKIRAAIKNEKASELLAGLDQVYS